MKRRDHIIFDHWDVWGWVYGLPLALASIFLMSSSALALTLASFLALGVLGSFVLICVLQEFS